MELTYLNLLKIETTLELTEIIRESVPEKYRRTHHPARKVFQAIRIEVNKELDVFTKALNDAIDMLNPGGRICVITFHSLEDRIVKQTFKELARECICPPNIPICVCGHKAKVKLITKKPIIASEEELKINSRSASAKLRVVEKV